MVFSAMEITAIVIATPVVIAAAYMEWRNWRDNRSYNKRRGD